jgi:hypothetical protein
MRGLIMSLGLRLALLPLLIAGCAGELLVVSNSDWQKVPAPERTEIDRQHEANVASARAELATASASLAQAQRSRPAPTAAPPAPTKPSAPNASDPAATGDDAIALRAQEQARVRTMAQVEAAKAAWQRADLNWRQLRVDAANARLAMLASQREYVRAQAVDRNLPGNDAYDIAPVRGQFSHAQQRWHNATNNVKQARDALDRASANLASAKEAYATLMRGGPAPSPTQPSTSPADQPPPQLTGWAVTRKDIRRRRGLRHFLDEGATPQLRSVAMQLRAPAISPSATPSSAAGSTIDGKPDGKPAPGTPQGNAPTAAPNAVAKPADRPAPPANAAAGTSTSGKPPAAAPQGNAPTTNNKPVAGVPQGNAPTAPAKPVDRPASSASAAAGASTNTKPPAEAPRSNTP